MAREIIRERKQAKSAEDACTDCGYSMEENEHYCFCCSAGPLCVWCLGKHGTCQMGRPRKQRQAKLIVDDVLSTKPSSRKSPELNREFRLARRELDKELSESMRLFRRKYKLEQLYNDSEDS